MLNKAEFLKNAVVMLAVAEHGRRSGGWLFLGGALPRFSYPAYA